MNYFDYKTYKGSIKASIEDNCLYGKIEFIADLVTYEANTIDELKREFEKAVDDYLTTCHEHGITPKNTCKGSFNVRIGSDLHQRLLAKADAAGTSLNDYLKGIIEKDTMTI